MERGGWVGGRPRARASLKDTQTRLLLLAFVAWVRLSFTPQPSVAAIYQVRADA